MKILAIETSCDETAIAIVENKGTIESPTFDVLGNSLISQVNIHQEYGGVYPNLARREHAKNLIPILLKTLKQSGLYKEKDYSAELDPVVKSRLEKIFIKEPELLTTFLEIIPNIEIPDIDLIAVTEGPGLAPALWVGINFAQGLNTLWNIKLIPVNHMEGHIWSVLFTNSKNISFPAIALLVSGGHTELVLVSNYGKYKAIGKTRDDAVGEAYDKVARLLGLPYPGGPEISKLAQIHRKKGIVPSIVFPQPMIHSNDLDFSYSGLKTAVLYKLKEFGSISDDLRAEISRAFEEAAISVLISKTRQALNNFEAHTLIVGGGVVANTYLREKLNLLKDDFPNLELLLPKTDLATDNAIMIALSAWVNSIELHTHPNNLTEPIRARANLSL